MGFMKMKYMFTVVNLYFLDVYPPCNFICDKGITGQKVSEKVPGSFRKHLVQFLYKNV
jgi:hypothetical protein